jgi:N4-gp56 family major capsid protein
MVVSPAYPPLVPQIWDDKFFSEYVRQSKYSRYMGTSEQSMFQVREDLTKKKGDKITFAKVGKLEALGVFGTTSLEGNEEILDQHAMVIQADMFRHAVAVTDWDEQKSAIPLRDVARSRLKTWEMERMKYDITNALTQVAVGTNADGTQSTIGIVAATAAQQNTWVVNNQDRVLFGALVSNYSATFATAAATITNTTVLTKSMVSLAKRLAQTANPLIAPIKTVSDDEEWYVLWCHPLCFRDLRLDPTLMTYQAQALPRAKDNILFTGGDILWDGVIIKELWELGVPRYLSGVAQAAQGTLVGVGGGGINVGVNVLAGAQAVGLAWAQRLKSTTNTRDYGFRHGVGIQEARGIQKLQFGRHYVGGAASSDAAPCDNGTFTIFASAVPDS